MILPIFFSFGICNVILSRLYPFTLLLMLQCSEHNLILLSRTRSQAGSLRFLSLNPVSKPAKAGFSSNLSSVLPTLEPPSCKTQPQVTNGRGYFKPPIGDRCLRSHSESDSSTWPKVALANLLL